MRKERDRLRTKVQSIALEMSSAVAKEGTILAAAVGSDQNFETLNKQAELNVQKHYEKVETKLQDVIDAAVESIQHEIEGVLQSNLVQTFVACLEKSQYVSAQNMGSGMDVEQIKGKVNLLKGIGETAGVQLGTLATRSFAKTASQGMFRSMDVVGGGLHQGVIAVGKFAGFKFRPWQAVGIAKNIGNAAKFLDPALAVVSVGVDLLQMQQEQQQEKQMADIRSDITSQFQTIAKNLESQVEKQLRELETQVYGEIDNQIAAARQQEENAIASSNKWVKQLAEIRKDFEAIKLYITKATEDSVV